MSKKLKAAHHHVIHCFGVVLSFIDGVAEQRLLYQSVLCWTEMDYRMIIRSIKYRFCWWLWYSAFFLSGTGMAYSPVSICWLGRLYLCFICCFVVRGTHWFVAAYITGAVACIGLLFWYSFLSWQTSVACTRWWDCWFWRMARCLFCCECSSTTWYWFVLAVCDAVYTWCIAHAMWIDMREQNGGYCAEAGKNGMQLSQRVIRLMQNRWKKRPETFVTLFSRLF